MFKSFPGRENAFEINGDIKPEGARDDDIKDGASGDAIRCDIADDDVPAKLGPRFAIGVTRDDVI